MIDATPLLRLHASRRLRALAAQDPAAVQQRTLLSLLRAASGTHFGRVHEFAAIGDVGTYQARVRLRRYEEFWAEYWQLRFPVLEDVTWPGRIPYFALTSGTTGATTKHIPLSREMVRSNRDAALDTLVFHIANQPRSRVLSGRSFMLGGSTTLTTLASGISEGDLSGIAATRVPLWARPRFFPPPSLALIADWDHKVAAMAEASLRPRITSISGTPSWLLVFFERLAALHPERPKRLVSFYPELELLVHGGVGFGPYRDRVSAWLEGSHAETREVYAASEGFIAIADAGPDDGMRLLLDRGLFYEFVPADALDAPSPERRWIADAELGVNYALVLTTNSGLWSYVLGDTVKLVSRTPPRVVVTGRTAQMLSAVGEHLIVSEIDAAVAEAARAVGASATDYAVGAVYPDQGDARGGHLFIVELDPHPDTLGLARFRDALDASLARLNADYAAHRQGDVGMRPPTVIATAPGTFTNWMRRRDKLGGQNKVPRVIQDATLLEDLRGFARAYR